MPDRHTLAETEKAMTARVSALAMDVEAGAAVSSLYRAANAVRLHLTNTVLRERGLTWTGFVVLWVVWIWDGVETRHAAESAAISKATLTGVVKTLEARGLIRRQVSQADRRLVNLELTPEGRALMEHLRLAGIPFIAAWGAIPGSTSGAHIHVGQPSPRFTVQR